MRQIPRMRRIVAAMLALCLAMAAAPAHRAQAAAPTYRALLIGNNGYRFSPLKGCINDARAMRSALMLSTGAEYARIELSEDLTAGGISGALDAARGWGQRDGDVTLFFYSGHGYSGAAGAGIVGTDMVNLSFSAVEARLAKIPGTVCVVIDSCYSGALIGKSASAGTAARFNEQALAAFGGGGDIRAKALSGPKYHVITACSTDEQSFESGGFGYFTMGVTEAMGWNAAAGKPCGSLVGDANGDGQLTIAEAFAHADASVRSLRRAGDQRVRAEPEQSKQVLAARSAAAADGLALPNVSGLPNLPSIAIAPGWTYQLASAGGYSWTSSDGRVALCGASGAVTGYREGKATIIGARSGQPTITVRVQVVPAGRAVRKIKLNHAGGARAAGKGFVLKASTSPSGAKDGTVRWYSTNSAVAKVSQAGKVMPLKPGTCRIYAIASSGAAAGFALTVPVQAVKRVQQKRPKASVGVGKALRLAARALPASASNRKLKWTSSDERIAVVGEDSGIVRGLKKGKVYITAAAMDGSGAKSRCLVTIK